MQKVFTLNFNIGKLKILKNLIKKLLLKKTINGDLQIKSGMTNFQKRLCFKKIVGLILIFTIFSSIVNADNKDFDKITDSKTISILSIEDDFNTEPLFQDLKEHWARLYIEDLSKKGVFVVQDLFQPTKYVTRAELAKIITIAFKLPVNLHDKQVLFKDIESHRWYAPYVNTCIKARLMKGYHDHTFQPKREINRAEALKTIIEAKGIEHFKYTSFFKDVPPNKWYTRYVMYAMDKGLIQGRGDKLFKPKENITRAELAKILWKALKI